MLPAHDDLPRRRPVWEALADLFLDHQLDESECRYIAGCVLDSGYSPSEVRVILWEEVFPVTAYNLSSPAGVWEGFAAYWLEPRIISLQGGDGGPCRLLENWRDESWKVAVILEDWQKVDRFLPVEWSGDFSPVQ